MLKKRIKLITKRAEAPYFYLSIFFLVLFSLILVQAQKSSSISCQKFNEFFSDQVKQDAIELTKKIIQAKEKLYRNFR